VLEFWAALYNELNRESKYFEIMTKLFEVYVRAGNIAKAAETLEKLVDIDPYDQRNQERLEMLRQSRGRFPVQADCRASGEVDEP